MNAQINTQCADSTRIRPSIYVFVFMFNDWVPIVIHGFTN